MNGNVPSPDSKNSPPPLPHYGRLAAVDFGTVRLGVAICDPDRHFASPLENYTRRSESLDAKFLTELADQERIVGWIVGLPVHGHGGESQKSTESRQFGLWLAQVTQRPVAFYDERYTTVQADEFLSQHKFTSRERKQRRDKLAAQILLTSYLEAPDRANANLEALD